MPLSYTKSNSKLLKENLSKSIIRSPKSVKTYIKEMSEEEKLKKTKNFSSPRSEENPTELNNVLNALKNSSKKKINFSIPNDEANEDICDFKNIGNLRNISFSLNNSFIENVSDDETEAEFIHEETANEEDLKKYIRLDEERVADDDSDDEDFLNLSNLNTEIILSQIQAENERFYRSKSQFLKMKNEYLENLTKIRIISCGKLQQLRLEEKNNLLREHQRLEEIQKAGSEEVLLAEENYMKDVARKKDEILKEVEALNLEEEKKSDYIQALIESLQKNIDVLKCNLSSIQAEAVNLSCEGELAKILFQELPSICESTEQTLVTMNKFSTTEQEIVVINRRIIDSLKIIEDIQRLLDGQKEQLLSLNEAQPAHGNPFANEPPPAYQPEAQPPVSCVPSPLSDLQKPDIDNTTASGTSVDLSPQLSQETEPCPKEEEYFMSLKTKFAKISEEANGVRENAQLRPLLSRAVGIINTLSNEKYDSSNKSKLQQLLNLINGRPCTIGSDNVSTSNNLSAQSFVKEQLATRLVSLGHDKQVATMSAYASIIVRLWQWYPEVGELILFKLLDTCPYLVPLMINRVNYQSDEDFYLALGMRIKKEKGTQEAFDKYLTRMEAAGQLYGRIISMDVDNHPHGIQEGWKWIARIITIPAHTTIAATVLYGFLSTAGAPLLGRYGKQFRKLLGYISTTYLPQAEKEILEGGRSAFVGLRSLLEQYQKTNSIPQVVEGYKLIL